MFYSAVILFISPLTHTLYPLFVRSVGIGAYLNRLGQRVIQMQQGPMILTGFSALNKLLGKEVYTSQDQLGGPQIMYPNGVTHEVVANDQEGMQSVIDWLNYTPKVRPTSSNPPPPYHSTLPSVSNTLITTSIVLTRQPVFPRSPSTPFPQDFSSVAPPAPSMVTVDPPSRPVEFMPSKTPYDPRHMLAGMTRYCILVHPVSLIFFMVYHRNTSLLFTSFLSHPLITPVLITYIFPPPSSTSADGSYVSGFFDKGSFKEYLGGWGKSVITGRGRLGGINVGVIAVETRLVEQRIPADPGNPESREAIQPQAGQVWYPDSAYKTAQAIQDFNRGENLPLIIFANWRGFSGGTRDMYGEILKFGAMIVDALRTYKHPVFVYIPPGGELRGGAWVVIDPTINLAKMEMYADKQARGGILEPPGICEVKYRSQEQKVTMHRLDAQLIELDEQMASSSSDSTFSEIKNREKTLAPLYTQVRNFHCHLTSRQ